MFNKKGQGAIEYLLLLAAAIVVVAIVISFLASVAGPTKDTGNQQTFDYLCKTLDSNTEECRCYLDKNIAGVDDCCGNDISDYIKGLKGCS